LHLRIIQFVQTLELLQLFIVYILLYLYA